MCRWFAYISPTEPCLIEDVLVSPDHSLCKQVNENYLPGLITSSHDVAQQEKEAIARNRYLNVDGFGIGYYNRTREHFTPVHGLWPIVYKYTQPPLRDANFRSLAANTSTVTLFAHIRASSGTPVVEVNNHPFVFGRQMIMHNGSIADFQRIKQKICERLDPDAYAAIYGGTDSEHFAALYMTFLRQHCGTDVDPSSAWDAKYPATAMKTALILALEALFAIQRSVLGEEAPGNSLNVCVTDGSSMVAMRIRNHEHEEPPSLYYSTTAGVSLNRRYPGTADGTKNPLWEAGQHWAKDEREHGPHVICASEPSTKDAGQWKLIPKNFCLLVDETGGVREEPMAYAVALNAVKATRSVGEFVKQLHGDHDRFGNMVNA